MIPVCRVGGTVWMIPIRLASAGSDHGFRRRTAAAVVARTSVRRDLHIQAVPAACEVSAATGSAERCNSVARLITSRSVSLIPAITAASG